MVKKDPGMEWSSPVQNSQPTASRPNPAGKVALFVVISAFSS